MIKFDVTLDNAFLFKMGIIGVIGIGIGVASHNFNKAVKMFKEKENEWKAENDAWEEEVKRKFTVW